MDNTVCGRCSVSKITQFRTCILPKNIYIFRHLKLGIALAIPASNDEKYNWNNSTGQGLMTTERQYIIGIVILSVLYFIQYRYDLKAFKLCHMLSIYVLHIIMQNNICAL